MFPLNKVSSSKGEYIYMGLNFQRGMNFFSDIQRTGRKITSLTSVGKIPGQSGLLFSLTPGTCGKNTHEMMGLYIRSGI